MAENVRISLDDDGESRLDLRPLLRFGGWGGCALAALAIAVFASRTDAGAQRADAALASITGNQPPQALRAAGAEMLARAEAEREARRTAEAVRVLAGDRDRLSQRIALLERSLDDLTGSIKRKAEPPPAAPEPPSPAAAPPTPVAAVPAPAAATASMSAAAAAAPAPAPAPSGPATTASAPSAPAALLRRSEEPVIRPMLAPVETVTAKELPAPAAPATAKPPPTPATMAMIQSYASATATPEPETPPPAAADGPAARPEFAIDLGGSTTVGGLRALWEKTRARQLKHLGNLRPLISVREGVRPGSTELRLVAGPFSNAAAAARLCAALVVSGVPCQPAMFDGQRLAQR